MSNSNENYIGNIFLLCGPASGALLLFTFLCWPSLFGRDVGGGGGGGAGAARKRKLGRFNFCLENCSAKVKSWLKTENR